MAKIEYRKIVWGLAIMAVIFAAPFLLPRAGSVLVHAYHALAQTTGSAPTLQGIDPPAGYPSTPINLYGTGFTVGNTVNFGTEQITNVQSSDDTSLTFDVPDTIGGTSTPPGQYNVTVTNGRGTSNPLTYTVLCVGDCGNPNDNLGTSTPNFPGPIYQCAGGFNCIEGFKVPWNLDIVAAQTVTLDGRYRATTTSWSFDQLPPGLHTISVTVPDGWYSGYTICINNVSCHGDIPIQGDSVTINFLSTNRAAFVDNNGLLNVPAGAYVDLYWHFSQNFGDFGSAPPGLNGGNVTGSSTVSRTQVQSYTAGGAANVGPNATYTQSIQAAFGQTAVNTLGCTIANILSAAIRGVIIGDQSLLKNPPPAQLRGGGGASIVIDDIGSKGPLRQLLPQITGNTLQNANDIRYTRAANIGFPNQPSWDAVTYCLENAMLKYIQQSTLNWMDTAFNGNPAFVQNLSQFLLGIQNQQAISFFKQLQQLNPGSPIQLAVYQGTVQNYTQNYGDRSRYTLNQYSQNPTAFINGDWSQGGFTAFSHAFDQGNYLPQAIYLASEEVNNQTSYATNIETTNYLANQGTLSVKQCSGNDTTSLSTDCKVVVPGRIINSNYDANAYLAQQRLSNNSGNYDQMVSLLVNQLIQTALGQLFKGLTTH
jgi:hypothetical protein